MTYSTKLGRRLVDSQYPQHERRSSGWKNREMERAAFLTGFDLGWRHCKGAPDHRKFEEDEK